jgi:hypothetical protein
MCEEVCEEVWRVSHVRTMRMWSKEWKRGDDPVCRPQESWVSYTYEVYAVEKARRFCQEPELIGIIHVTDKVTRWQHSPILVRRFRGEVKTRKLHHISRIRLLNITVWLGSNYHAWKACLHICNSQHAFWRRSRISHLSILMYIEEFLSKTCSLGSIDTMLLLLNLPRDFKYRLNFWRSWIEESSRHSSSPLSTSRFPLITSSYTPSTIYYPVTPLT